MKMKILATAAALAAMFVATAASALSYNWSFEATGGTSTGPVTGTISGLNIGSNDGTGLIVNVLSSPSGNVLGGGWVFEDAFGGGDAFTVALDGTITFADAWFSRDAGNDSLSFGQCSSFISCPQIYSDNEADGPYTFTSHSNFSPQSTLSFSLLPTTVPVPASFPLLALGIGGLGYMTRRKRKVS